MGMGRKDLVNIIKFTTSCSENKAKIAVDAILDAMYRSLCEGKEVRLWGVATIQVREGKSRKGKAFGSREYNTPAMKRLKIRASSILMGGMNK